MYHHYYRTAFIHACLVALELYDVPATYLSVNTEYCIWFVTINTTVAIRLSAYRYLVNCTWHAFLNQAHTGKNVSPFSMQTMPRAPSRHGHRKQPGAHRHPPPELPASADPVGPAHQAPPHPVQPKPTPFICPNREPQTNPAVSSVNTER